MSKPFANLKNFSALPLLWALLFFGLLWRLDFPKPMVDDLFYTQAGVNLAQGGDLSNPMLARQGFSSHFFFVYPPLHSYALAGWLKMFAISAKSMTAFPIAMYWITAAATIALLRKYQAPGWLDWLVPLAVSTALLPVGLRPEPLSIALTMAGFAIFECSRRGMISTFCAFLLMALGASAAPRMAFFSVALAAFAALRLEAAAKDGRARLIFRLAMIFALAATVLIFLAQIHFRAGEFWEMFHLHAHRVAGRKLNLLFNFLNENPYLTNAQFPLLLLLGGLVFFKWRQPIGEASRASLALMLAFPVVALIGGLGAGTLWYINFALLLFVTALIRTQPRLQRKMEIILTLVLLFANVKPAVMLYGQATGKITNDQGEQSLEAAAMRSTPERAIIIDHQVARYIFDYRIPPGFLDIEFSAPFPKTHAVEDMRPGDIYLVGPENVEVLKENTLLNLDLLKWGPFALPANRRLHVRPRQVFIIPAKDCGGVRPSLM